MPEDSKMTPITVMGTEYSDKTEAGTALIEACKQLKAKETLDIGEYRGFTMSVSYDSFGKTFNLELKREMTYTATVGSDPQGNIHRINNALNDIPDMLKTARSQHEALQSQLEAAKGELGKPFPREAELNEKLVRLVELNALLSSDGAEGIEEPAAAEKSKDTAADKPPSKMTIHDKLMAYKESEKSGDKGKAQKLYSERQ